MTREVAKLVRGTLLGKMDVKSAYRILVPVNQDFLLLGVQWDGKTYLDAQLSFGLRSAPMIITVLADALEWIVK